MRVGTGMRVPALNMAKNRPQTGVSSAMSGYTEDTVRMDELSKVKQELEQALAQVKMEMKEGGASRSQVGSSRASGSRLGGSTCRSQSVMSDVTGISAVTSSTVPWDLDDEIANVNKVKPNRKLSTHRGRAKLDLKNKGPKPLVQRPTKNKNSVLPAPSPSAFRTPTHVTSNQSEYTVLGPIAQSNNQGPHRHNGPRKESSRPFTKACESNVNTSSITGSRVFAQRVAAR